MEIPRRASKIALHDAALEVQRAQFRQGRGVAQFGGSAEQIQGLRLVIGQGLAAPIHRREAHHCFRLPLLRRLRVPIGGRAPVDRCAAAPIGLLGQRKHLGRAGDGLLGRGGWG